MKMIKIKFEVDSIEIDDENDMFWNAIINPDFDWHTPLLIKDSTNPMNNMILNLEKATAITRFSSIQKDVDDIIDEK